METSKYASLNFPCREEEEKQSRKSRELLNQGVGKNKIETVIRLFFLILPGKVG